MQAVAGDPTIFGRGIMVPAVARGRRPADLSSWKLRQFIGEAQLRGVPVTPLLQRHGVDDPALAGRDETVAFDTMRTTLNVLAHEMPPDFAIGLGRKWHLREFRMFGYALLSSRTFGEFSDRWIGHFEFLGIPLAFRSIVEDGVWRLEMSPKGELSEGALRLSVEEACASVFPIFEQVTGGILRAERIEISFGDASYAERLSRLMDAPVAFRARGNALVMSTKSRSQRVAVDRATLIDFCQRNCAGIAPSLSGEPLLDRLRESLLLSCGRPPSLERAAEELDVSKRTLNRALATHGWTYSAASQLYQRDFALEMLRMREIATKEIAYILGYGGTESFRRAFRKWTGQTVSKWARHETGLPPPRA